MRRLKVHIYNRLEKRIWFLATLSKKCEDRNLYFARLLCVIIARMEELKEKLDQRSKEAIRECENHKSMIQKQNSPSGLVWNKV